jgi:hypothetical protein
MKNQEAVILKRNRLIGLAIIPAFLLVGTGFGKLFAQEKKVAVEELVAAHIKSIGHPEVLKRLHSRWVSGSAAVKFVQGAAGDLGSGSFLIASEKNKVGIRMLFGAINYPGEYFAFDGQDVTVGHINPGERSLLGDFIFRFNEIMREGLLGSALSTAWPLLNIGEKHATLTYSKGKLNGRPVHVINYRFEKSSDVTAKLFFDLENYHYVRTEYVVRHTTLPTSNIMSSPPNAIYSLTEKFDDFETVGDLTLPHSYTMEYSAEGQGLSFVAAWTMNAGLEIVNNKQIGLDFFKAEK